MTTSDRWRVRTRTRRQALDRYRGFLQETLNCISDAFWRVGEGRSAREFVLLTTDDPLALRRNDGSTVYLAATQHFHYEPDRRWGKKEWKVKTDRYEYTLSPSETLDVEFVAWHWHPATPVDTPHIHFGEHHEAAPSLHKWHIPTGRISFEQVVRFAITDLEVVPRRDDYEQVLSETEGRFRTFGTWR